MEDQDSLRSAFSAVITKQIDDARQEATESGWSQGLWRCFEEEGFTVVAVPETAGGSGGTLVDLATMLKVAGYHAAPAPLAEPNVAAWALAGAGCDVIPGPLAVVPDAANHPVKLSEVAGEWRAAGSLSAVPWAGCSDSIVVLAGDAVTPKEHPASGPLLGVVARAECELTPGVNLAGEPCEDVRLPPDGVEMMTVPNGSQAHPAAVQALSVLTSALLMTGSLRRVLDLSVLYARQREQFGRPIDRFQAVQQHLAHLAGGVEQAEAIVDTAVVEFGAELRGEMSVLAAKTCAAEVAQVAISVGHQIHGAIGMTAEHELHHHTRRLMAWRDVYGSEIRSGRELGRLITQMGPDALWELLTGPSSLLVSDGQV